MYSIPDPAPLEALLRVPALESMRDEHLLAYLRHLGAMTRRIETAAALASAEVARRSSRELGYRGLAQRLGARTPEMLVQQTLGASRGEARDLVTVGALVTADTAPAWSAAVHDGSVSVGAAAAIESGLGTATEAVPQPLLDLAAQGLIADAAALTVEQLARRAREVRDELDANGVADRESERRDRRFLRLTPLPDGMTRLLGLLDPESAAVVVGVINAATSPRRGGPRFTAAADIARAEELAADARTTEQIACDAFVQLLDAGARVDPDRLLIGSAAPVQVIVAATDLERGSGFALLEGQTASVSIDTARRAACTGGTVAITIGRDGQPLNHGRARRLFSRAQRRAIAARDGGCLFCERPPSWTEAHHIVDWARGGPTDVADGVLLCRFHHLMVHNNGWRVIRRGGKYFLVPPTAVDPLQREIPARRRSPVLERALAQSPRSAAAARAPARADSVSGPRAVR